METQNQPQTSDGADGGGTGASALVAAPVFPRKHVLIVIDGGEGLGKSTVIERVKAAYPEPGVRYLREPGGSDFGEKEIRRLMLKSEYSEGLTPYEHMNLAFAGRSVNIREIVIPEQDAGKPLIADRWDSSTFSIQVFGMETDLSKRLFAHFDSCRTAMGPLDRQPTLYIILDAPVEVGMARVREREMRKNAEFNHFDKKGSEFHARVREGYKRFAQLHRGVKEVDATKSKDEVCEAVLKLIEDHLIERGHRQPPQP